MINTVIIGGGIGGFTLARELRSLNEEVSIAIIDPEGLPYDRPPLSKEILNGAKTTEQILLAPAEFYEEKAIEIITGHAVSVDADARVVTLEDGRTIEYENLVLATGGLARSLPTPGFDDPDVRVLRTAANALDLKAALVPGSRLAIIGAGLIGAEVASSAHELGAEVTLIDPQPVALIPAVGDEIAQRLHSLHAANGVEFVNGVVTRIDRDGADFILHVDDHAEITADHVLIAVGIVPEEKLARSARLDCDNGVLVDASQQTSHPHIWAIGDCARHRNPDGSLERRHEHWESAVCDAQIAAAAINHSELPTRNSSWFWTDRYNVHVEGVGSMSVKGTTIIRPDATGQPQVAFRMNEDGTMAGCAAIDAGMAVRAARRIIDQKIVVDQEKLADPTVNLKKLAR
ncbi:Pyridine nucleotide-disulfide oxidoreductase/Reductase C-terminal [Corynebacterium mustelae]|uniref:Pyridine nucleotide-disulfide oxidoreductase/Reductase C-terminal n=1 Tax=Corynebacterium mustelae TaxID=571915 RepID=A0A0G3H853_9CORY|nr:FAD-dependent oxidoreductase [Corynebacterium mustelae]AKK07307.1 Pyridine nucleotide-disulfide oxidoreductase/Reductase C-terminal [Corynebacterium mustelae]